MSVPSPHSVARQPVDAADPDHDALTEPDAPAGAVPVDPDRAADVGGRRRPWWLVVPVVAIGYFLSVLDMSVAGVAYGAIQDELGANNIDLQWITTAYKLSQGVAIPLAVWWCERYGLRRMYLVSLAWFAVSAGLCGLATDFTELVALRVIEGFPGGLTPVICIAMLSRVVPARKLVMAAPVYAICVITAPAFSPVVGGALVQHANWRWTFFITVPFALVGILAASVLLPPLPGPGTTRPFDWPGFITISVGLFTLLLALQKAPDWGWASYRVLGLLAVGIDALFLFVIVERQVAHPLLDLRVFADRTFVVALCMLEVLFTGLMAVLNEVPQFLQQVQGLTPTNSGLVLVPQAIVWLLTVPFAARAYRRFGPTGPASCGLAVIGTATLLMVRVNVDLPRPILAALLCLRAFGVGLAVLPLMAGAVSRLAPELSGAGITFRTVLQRVGSSLGLALITAFTTTQRTLISADRSALLDPAHHPGLFPPELPSDSRLSLALYQQTQQQVAAQTYSDVFLILGVLSLAAATLPFLVRWGRIITGYHVYVERGV